MKRAFTLIEIVIVLVIIGILMGVTMKFWSNRITDLKAQSFKDKFADSYTSVVSQDLASSYHGQEHYQSVHIFIDSGMSYQYDSGVLTSLIYDPQHMSLTNLQLNDHAVSSIQLSLTPYHIWCANDGSSSGVVSFQLLIDQNKKYCFGISLDTCALSEAVCE